MPSSAMAMVQQDATRAAAVSYFYGRISRDEAEDILVKNGMKQGLFLLRENVTVAGNYALSICHNGRTHHYCIERQPDGTVKIPDGRPFLGPVELINHHSRFLDGFLTKPTIPCARPNGTAPMAWPGVTMLELEQALIEEADKQGLKGNRLENVLGPQRQRFVCTVAKTLHLDQEWFHDKIDRDEADKRMKKSGHYNGKFLVRVRDKDSFALSISYDKATKHYRVDKHKVDRANRNEEKLAIEDGPKFDNLMDMIAHYYNKTDGLLCKLSKPCRKPGWVKTERFLIGTSNNPIYGAPIANPSIDQSVFDGGNFEEPDTPEVTRPLPPVPNAELQKIYDLVPRSDDVFNLNPRDLKLSEVLGNGNFGSVVQGIYKHRGREVPVAVKQLKRSDISTAEDELLSEARLMADLNHPHVVRMIGVSKAETIMLVLELASLGPLNRYLKQMKAQVSIPTILKLMQQVAQGMAYLESINFVHRDLAARNVLLASEDMAKISDFGMSKALGIGNDYYKADKAGKWPLKWYAPECIYFYKFDSKSDVWSYGVTLWEATSYGGKPYRGMKGNEIVRMIDSNERMEKPPACPDDVYSIMLRCWQHNSNERPSFKELVKLMEGSVGSRSSNGH